MLTKDEARELTNGSLEHKGLWFKLRLCMMYAKIDRWIERGAELGESTITFEIDDIPAKKYFPVMKMYYENLGFFVAYRTGNNRSRFVVSWDYDKLPERDKLLLQQDYHYRTFDDPDVRESEEGHKKKKNGSAVMIPGPRSVIRKN